MQRRDFLRFAGLSTSGLLLPSAVSRAFAQSPTDRWRTYEVTTRVEVLKPAGRTRIWLPTPLTVDTPYQKSLGSSFNAEGATRFANLTGPNKGRSDLRQGAGDHRTCLHVVKSPPNRHCLHCIAGGGR